MNAFEKFGRTHLSATQLLDWRECPALWVMQNLFNVRGEAGPAAWRGKAVEDGFTAFLHGKEALPVAMSTYEANVQGEISDKITQQRALIAPMLARLIGSWNEGHELVATQLRFEHWLDGVPIPFIGYIDYLFTDHILELKTTERIPSSPRDDHKRQVALYRAARNAPANLIYVSDKKIVPFPIGDNEAKAALDELRADALSLEAFLSRMETPLDALHSLPLHSGYWKMDEKMTAAHAQLLEG